jgi:hypothetical protein
VHGEEHAAGVCDHLCGVVRQPGAHKLCVLGVHGEKASQRFGRRLRGGKLLRGEQ